MPLLTAKDFEDLPNGQLDRWLALRDLLEHRLASEKSQGSGLEEGWLFEYTAVLSSAADELGLGLLQQPSPADIHETFEVFRSDVAALATRLSLRKQKISADQQLLMSKPIRARLADEVDRLRGLIASSNLDKGQKTKLLALLNKLSEEIEREELNYARTMRAIALCAAGLGGSAAFFADAPSALSTIVELIGLQQEAEDSKQEVKSQLEGPAVPSLPAPAKQLPAPESDTDNPS